MVTPLSSAPITTTEKDGLKNKGDENQPIRSKSPHRTPEPSDSISMRDNQSASPTDFQVKQQKPNLSALREDTASAPKGGAARSGLPGAFRVSHFDEAEAQPADLNGFYAHGK